MKIRRDVLMVSGLLIVLLLVTVFASIFQTKTEQIPPLSSESNLPNGARALRLWMEEMGYQVNNAPGSEYAVPAETRAVLILEPSLSSNITSEEWKTLRAWVSEGGLLLLASREIWFNLTTANLPVSATSLTGAQKTVLPAAPIFRAPPVMRPLRLAPRFAFVFQQGQKILPLLDVDGRSVAVDIPEGKGHIILVADSGFLTNAGLKEPGSGEWMLNVLAELPAGSAIWFDEWHHGERATGEQTNLGPEAWLTNTPSGLALLYAFVVNFVFLLLAGRRFGRPVPLQRDMVRRAPLEYVTALAGLNQRAGHRRALLQHYRVSLKRAFGRRYRMDAGLPDDEYVAQLARYKPDLDSAALLNLLQRLNQKNVSETQMVQLAREAAGWIQTIEH